MRNQNIIKKRLRKLEQEAGIRPLREQPSKNDWALLDILNDLFLKKSKKQLLLFWQEKIAFNPDPRALLAELGKRFRKMAEDGKKARMAEFQAAGHPKTNA